MVKASGLLAQAVALHQAGHLAEAEPLYRRVLQAEPRNADALHYLGLIAHQRGENKTAIKFIRKAIASNGASSHYHNNMGEALRALGKLDEAAKFYKRALDLPPVYHGAHYNLGLVLTEQRDWSAAAECFRQALLHDPEDAEVHASLADMLLRRGNAAAAVEEYRIALDAKPDSARFHCNLGLALTQSGELETAIGHYRNAVALEPDNAELHYTLGFALLRLGRFAEAWPHYQRRLGSTQYAPRAELPESLHWRGEFLNGERVLLHEEQGAGDTIQFIRYAPLVAARGGRVMVANVRPELCRLLSWATGVEQVVPAGRPLPDFAVHSPIPSLPALFRTNSATIPARLPYIDVPPAETAAWRDRLKAKAGIRVGLVWAGSPGHDRDRDRSLDLADLAPLGQIPGVSLFSLQVGPASAQAEHPPSGMALTSLTPALGDFADTACAIVNLDLVISVDTAVAHLAGALGRPVWILLAYAADWRWFLDRGDSPWYPSARLFRQAAPGGWPPVIERVAGELRLLAAMRQPTS